MSDTPHQEPDVSAAQASPGEMLRRAREAMELSRDEVAEALNLRPAVIDGLERDDYDEVPIATYRRGYLRSYASLLDLDPEQVLAAYQARVGTDDLERKVTPVHVVNKPPSRLGAWLFRLATLVVIAGLVGLTLLWWQSRGGSQPPTPGDNAPVAVDSLDGTTTITGDDGEPVTGNAGTDEDWSSRVATAAEQPAPAEAPESPAPAAAETASPSPAEPESGTDAPATEEAIATAGTEASPEAEPSGETDEAAPAPTEPTGDARVLELTFNEQSWTEIFDANNERVFVGLQEPGTTARVEGEPPFRLTVGNATGVELVWRGEPVDLAPRTGANNVARFTLGE
ncbi:RodZ domain-containing protein [Halomonas beimenensis]|uniref:Cytoskeleton protein RodZ n=1 Tax=Halomonas beimenensis TaxID=475662 RepID=A0A291P3D8_9GAMM|nr:RodZ domain-containing protein [Halomonas beimenensis]ATJ81401.1 cytoskeleton protein RodZ [Halomonas beimenensis]